MRTLGIDLSAQPKDTAACTITWGDGKAVVDLHPNPLNSDEVLDLTGTVDFAGIDAPFGWPIPFVEAITAHDQMQDWLGRDRPEAEFRRSLTYRATDLYLMERGMSPLSVSGDKLGVTAMRCTLLLDRIGRVDRTGAGKVLEVYPAAALYRWQLPFRGYKQGKKNEPARDQLISKLMELAPWLTMTSADREACVRSDHILDALISSLVVRAAKTDRTCTVPEEHRTAAEREGWIHVPVANSLSDLVRP